MPWDPAKSLADSRSAEPAACIVQRRGWHHASAALASLEDPETGPSPRQTAAAPGLMRKLICAVHGRHSTPGLYSNPKAPLSGGHNEELSDTRQVSACQAGHVPDGTWNQTVGFCSTLHCQLLQCQGCCLGSTQVAWLSWLYS